MEEERTFPKVYSISEREGDKESIGATVAVPGDHCFPPTAPPPKKKLFETYCLKYTRNNQRFLLVFSHKSKINCPPSEAVTVAALGWSIRGPRELFSVQPSSLALSSIRYYHLLRWPGTRITRTRSMPGWTTGQKLIWDRFPVRTTATWNRTRPRGSSQVSLVGFDGSFLPTDFVFSCFCSLCFCISISIYFSWIGSIIQLPAADLADINANSAV